MTPRRTTPPAESVPGAGTGEGGIRLVPGDRAVVTGAGGFIGSAIVRALLRLGVHTVAVTEPGGTSSNLAGLDVDHRVVDIRDPAGLRPAVEGTRAVFHTAAIYRFWARDPRSFYDVNVGGTRNVLDAAAAAGSERVVFTSTVGTLGLHGPAQGRPADERDVPEVNHLFGLYKQSKYVAEHEVLRAAAEGLPACLVLPTFPLGSRDVRPTPTGKVVLDFLNGRMPGFADTAMNVAHVDDVAAGHLLALERGRNGRSYILGGENFTMAELLSVLASCTGLPAPTLRVPPGLALAVAVASHLVEGRLLGREPSIPLEAARMAATRMMFDDSRARSELGYTSRPAAEAVSDSARWFVENGYVRPARVTRIRWSPARPDRPS